MKNFGKFVSKNSWLCLAACFLIASGLGYLLVPSIGSILAIIGGLFVVVHILNRYFMAR